jgi:hypothetical protein
MNVLVCVMGAINVGIYFLFWLLVLWQQLHREALATCALAVGVQKSKHRNVCINIIWIYVLILYCMTCFIVLYLIYVIYYACRFEKLLGQIYYILRYSVKIVLSTHTNSLPFTCPFYDMVSYICNPKSPLRSSLFKETQKHRMSTFKKIIKMD